MSGAIIKADRLQLGYLGQRPIFAEPLSFEIADQKITAIIGANGSGKSTLIKSLVGEPHVLSGQLSVLGEDAQDLTPQKLKGLIAFVPQEPRFPGHLQLQSFLKLSFLGQVGWFEEIAQESLTSLTEILELFELDRLKSQTLGSLSSGERQRAFLARAFLQQSKLLLLDEPSNHLDPKATRTLAKTLRRAVSAKSKSVLFATHDRLLVEAIANHAVALRDGRLCFAGSLSSAEVAGLFSRVFE